MLNNRRISKSALRPDPREMPLYRAVDDCLSRLQAARFAVRDYTAEVVKAGHASLATRKELRAALLAALELSNWLGMTDAEANQSDGSFDCVSFDPDTGRIIFDAERKNVTLMGEIMANLLFRTSSPK